MAVAVGMVWYDPSRDLVREETGWDMRFYAAGGGREAWVPGVQRADFWDGPGVAWAGLRRAEPAARADGGCPLVLITTPQRKGNEITPPQLGSSLEGPRSARTWP
jgi:hypothetical protein